MNKKEREELKERVIKDFNKSLNNKDVENVVKNFIATSRSDPGKEKNRKEAKLWKLEL